MGEWDDIAIYCVGRTQARGLGTRLANGGFLSWGVDLRLCMRNRGLVAYSCQEIFGHEGLYALQYYSTCNYKRI